MIQLDFSKPAPKPSSIEECHAVIDALWTFCGNLQKEVELLKLEVISLKNENAKLKERLNSNSNNSSKPPSTDFKKKKRNNHKKSGRNQGSQPGHKGVSRILVPTVEVDTVLTCPPPDKCLDCNIPLSPLKKIIRHQVYEIPLPRFEITEYQIMRARCSCCQKTYHGETPKEVGRRGFGVRVHAAIALLTSKFKLSKRQALELLKDFYQMPMCVGSVSNIEHRVSHSLETLHQQIKNKIDQRKN